MWLKLSVWLLWNETIMRRAHMSNYKYIYIHVILFIYCLQCALYLKHIYIVWIWRVSNYTKWFIPWTIINRKLLFNENEMNIDHKDDDKNTNRKQKTENAIAIYWSQSRYMDSVYEYLHFSYLFLHFHKLHTANWLPCFVNKTRGKKIMSLNFLFSN